jgi:hypothetical protein
MADVRLVEAPISITFEPLVVSRAEAYNREFQQLSESDDDPIMQWLKLAKAKGETADSDMLVVNLLVELHRKVDRLEMLIKKEKPKRIELAVYEVIAQIGFDHFDLKHPVLEAGKKYYGRVEMPTYPKRDVAIFFIAKTANLAEITKMHDRDEKEWNAYVTARERVMIRQMKGNN